MTIISIIGAPGVGKSFLVKQISAKYNLPVIFEGEEGAIPNEILENIHSGENPIRRWEWFLEAYRKKFETVLTISNAGLTCITDSGFAMLDLLISSEKAIYREQLTKLIQKYSKYKPDKTTLLVASEQKLRELMQKRNRKVEQDVKAINRALQIQEELKRKNFIIIDRINLEFTNEKDLTNIGEQIL